MTQCVRRPTGLFAGLLTVAALLFAPPALGATIDVVIDFEENLVAGDVVDELDCDTGIDCGGADVPGHVSVLGHNPRWIGDPNAAYIFDSSNPTCGDTDLGTPNQDFSGPGIGSGGREGSEFENDTPLGNLLIVQEDPRRSDCIPDDADVDGAFLELDFANFGPGVATVNSLYVVDIEVEQAELPATVQVFEGGCEGDEVGEVNLPSTGNNGVALVIVDLTGDCMRINLRGSGGFTDIDLTLEQENGEGEGCTPGYWRQPHHFDSWTAPYTPDTLFKDVFGRKIEVGAGGRNTVKNPTLLQAVVATGGGVSALARHAVAALLNAASPDVNYGPTVAEVIAMVQGALDEPATIESVKDALEELNERGCPLN